MFQRSPDAMTIIITTEMAALACNLASGKVQADTNGGFIMVHMHFHTVDMTHKWLGMELVPSTAALTDTKIAHLMGTHIGRCDS